MMGSGIPKMGVGCFWRLVLAVNFGGCIWRVAWRPPPRAPRARKNGIFLPFLSKIGVIFVIFCEN